MHRDPVIMHLLFLSVRLAVALVGRPGNCHRTVKVFHMRAVDESMDCRHACSYSSTVLPTHLPVNLNAATVLFSLRPCCLGGIPLWVWPVLTNVHQLVSTITYVSVSPSLPPRHLRRYFVSTSVFFFSYETTSVHLVGSGRVTHQLVPSPSNLQLTEGQDATVGTVGSGASFEGERGPTAATG